MQKLDFISIEKFPWMMWKALYRWCFFDHAHVHWKLNCVIKTFMWKLVYSLKFSNMTMIDNVLFISKELNNMCPPIFKNWFQFCYNIHPYSASSIFIKRCFRMNNFGKFSVKISVVDFCNKIQVQMGEVALKDLRPS